MLQTMVIHPESFVAGMFFMMLILLAIKGILKQLADWS